jgi:hypothetical protein
MSSLHFKICKHFSRYPDFEAEAKKFREELAGQARISSHKKNFVLLNLIPELFIPVTLIPASFDPSIVFLSPA